MAIVITALVVTSLGASTKNENTLRRAGLVLRRDCDSTRNDGKGVGGFHNWGFRLALLYSSSFSFPSLPLLPHPVPFLHIWGLEERCTLPNGSNGFWPIFIQHIQDLIRWKKTVKQKSWKKEIYMTLFLSVNRDWLRNRGTIIIFYVEFFSKHAFSAVSAPIFSKLCHTT